MFARSLSFGSALIFCGMLLFAPLTQAGPFPASGQTTAYQANKNDGIAGPVDVPDDGALQRGATLKYKVLKDGTVKDLNTGLVWEVKCSGCGGLHDVGNTYAWSGNGSQETIWDWIEDINNENGGDGYLGYNDWRIPNVRELQSIADYGRAFPAVDPLFGPSAATYYWSSTTIAFNSAEAWVINTFGASFNVTKTNTLPVRAVRGGPK